MGHLLKRGCPRQEPPGHLRCLLPTHPIWPIITLRLLWGQGVPFIAKKLTRIILDLELRSVGFQPNIIKALFTQPTERVLNTKHQLPHSDAGCFVILFSLIPTTNRGSGREQNQI